MNGGVLPRQKAVNESNFSTTHAAGVYIDVSLKTFLALHNVYPLSMLTLSN
jgi:hypothetical protein